MVCLDNDLTLLKSAKYFIFEEKNEQSKLQGTYLHYNKNNYKWVRSGKITGRIFNVLNKEHNKYTGAQNMVHKTITCITHQILAPAVQYYQVETVTLIIFGNALRLDLRLRTMILDRSIAIDWEGYTTLIVDHFQRIIN